MLDELPREILVIEILLKYIPQYRPVLANINKYLYNIFNRRALVSAGFLPSDLTDEEINSLYIRAVDYADLSIFKFKKINALANAARWSDLRVVKYVCSRPDYRFQYGKNWSVKDIDGEIIRSGKRSSGVNIEIVVLGLYDGEYQDFNFTEFYEKFITIEDETVIDFSYVEMFKEYINDEFIINPLSSARYNVDYTNIFKYIYEFYEGMEDKSLHNYFEYFHKENLYFLTLKWAVTDNNYDLSAYLLPIYNNSKYKKNYEYDMIYLEDDIVTQVKTAKILDLLVGAGIRYDFHSVKNKLLNSCGDESHFLQLLQDEKLIEYVKNRYSTISSKIIDITEIFIKYGLFDKMSRFHERVMLLPEFPRWMIEYFSNPYNRNKYKKENIDTFKKVGGLYLGLR